MPVKGSLRQTDGRNREQPKTENQRRKCIVKRNPDLRVDTVVEDKLAFKLVKTSGHCSAVHRMFLITLDVLVTTTSTDSLASKGTLNL